MLLLVENLRARVPVRLQTWLKLVNRRTVLLGAGILGCLLYGGLYAVPKHVNFSYAAATCTGDFALLPGMNKAVDDATFKTQYGGGVTLGGVQVASTRICFVPKAAPRKGLAQVASAPFGGWAFKTTYDVRVGDAPLVLETKRQAQALSQPLGITLNQPDRVFQYQLDANGKTQGCTMSAAKLQCGVDKLGLSQGASYALKLQRSFGGRPAGDAISLTVAILPATKVIAASIAPSQMLYTKPQSADLTLDKPLASAAAKLEQVDGDKTTPIDMTAKVDGAHVLLTWGAELPREKTFRLTLTNAATSDGSTLDGAYSVSFQTSGGPKVVRSSIGAGGVAGDARVVISFDQPLSPAANVASLASISGGAATISRQGSSQVVFALHDMPRCGAFSLTIAKGVLSESGIAAGAGWAQASRISCGTSRVIGYSVKGRPIIAYFYGTGATTVLFTGGIHGNEPSGTYIMQDWVNYLDTNGYQIPASKQVVVVPNVNPDGIAINQRYNMNNVNIDRNFPTSDWISDISLTNGQVLPHGGGAVPMSEPETKAIAGLTSSLHVRVEVSFHSSGALVGANKVADSVAIGSLYAHGVGYGTMFDNPEAIMGYTLTGEYETWMGEQFGTPAILIELPTATGRYFSRHLSTLWNMVNL